MGGYFNADGTPPGASGPGPLAGTTAPDRASSMVPRGRLDDAMVHNRRLIARIRSLETSIRRWRSHCLSPDEKAVLDDLKGAYERFVRLPDSHPSEPVDFANAIHRLQDLVTARVARRMEPDHWWQPTEELR